MATGWLGAIPPPPGVNPNFVDPISQENSNIALHTICLTLATASVALRLYTRVIITKASLGADDFLCAVSWALTITFSGLLLESYQWGIGRHMWDVPAIWIPTALKYFTIAQYIFQCLQCFIKLTFLVLYYRIFWAQPKVVWAIYGGAIFVIASNVGMLFATIFSCTPVARAWNVLLPGHCINTDILPWLSGSLASFTDLYILFLPMGPLWQLNMIAERKWKLIAVFGLGSFACIASLVRLSQTPVLRSSFDASWNISKIAVWAVLEVNIGLICASSSLFPAFLDRHLPKSIKDSIAHIWSYTISRDRSNRASSKISSGRQASGQPESDSWNSHNFVELRDAERAKAGKDNAQ